MMRLPTMLFFAFFVMIASCTKVFATTFTDLKFGRYQIADSQWNVSACMYTNTCEIYSTQPGTMYRIPWWNGQWNWQTGQYVQFNMTGDATNPYEAKVYNSNGSVAGVIGTGRIINMGTDSNGKSLFFFVGNDNNTGQLFSTNYGLTGTGGYTWTGTLNPTIAQVDAFASTGSTSPLAPGETATSTPPPPPTISVVGGTITQTNAPADQTITSGSAATVNLTPNQQSRVNNWTGAGPRPSANGIDIDVNGVNNSIYIEQVGNSNLVTGIGESAARVIGSGNTITVKQGTTAPGQNEIQMRISGDGNTLEVGQARTNTGIQTGTNAHYQAVDINGFQNNVVTQQSNVTLGSHYQETTINGNQNNVTARQTDNGNKIMFNTVNGNNNTVDVVQKDGGQHQLTNRLTGNNHSVTVVQEGAQQNKANIDLVNSGGAAALDLLQSGGMNFTIQQSCTNPAGCTTTVRQ